MTAEALRNSSAVGLFIAPRPFSPHLDASEVAPGTSIGRMLTRAVNDGVLAADDLDLVRVYVDGQPLPCATPEERAAAFDLIPEAGQLVNLSVEPEGGSNSDARSGLALLFNVIGTIAAFTVGPFTAAMWFLAAATVPNLLFPINEPDRLETANDRGALQGAQNAIRRRDMMPLQLGRSREAFDVAAAPFTRLIGNDVWLTVIFGVHYGPCTVENIRIGETALADYPAADVRIVEHLSPGPRDFTLYPARVAQENLSDQLEMGGAFEVHTTQANAERIEADLTWPAGLRFNKENGSILPQETRLEVQWQALDANGDPVGPYAAAPLEGGPYRTRQGATLPTGQIEVQGRTQDALRRTLAWNTGAKGRYNVRIRAWDPDGDDPSKAVQDVYWTALRTIETGKPILDETLSVIEFQIRSSDDLSGQLPVVTAEITPLAPVWDGDEWFDEPEDWAPTSNAAALARMLLMGPGAARPMSGAEFDASCGDAYELIEARGWHAGFRLAQNTTQEEALQALGAMGRFSCYDPGDGLRFVTDWEKPATRQMFTGRNVQGYRFSRAFPEAVHAVIVEFRNLDESSEPDELIVYMDGYAEEAGDGVQAAELFESLRIPYACAADRAYREGRVWLAKRVHQVERHEWTAAADSIVSTYGDRVAVAHRSALFGQRAARVAHRHLSGGLVAGVRLDEPVEMVEGEDYALDVRRADQVLAGLEVTTVDGRHRDLWFPTPLAAASAPEAGDLCVFGLSGQVTEDLELVDVDPQPDGKARLAAVKYIAAELEAAETGPIPPFETRVTARPRAPTPRILGTVGDPNGVRVIFDVDPVRGALVEGFAVRWRRSVAEVSPDEIAPGWVSLPPLGANAREAVTPPVLDAAAPDVLTEAEWSVDVEIRSILRSGAISVPAVASAVRVKRTVAAPENFAATGVTRTAPDGSSFGAIEVSCDPLEAGPTQDLVVEHQPAGSDPEAWVSAGHPLPSRNPTGDFLAGLSGQSYDVRARWRTQDNWTSDWVVVEDVTIPAGSEVSTDTLNVAGRPSLDVTEALDDLAEAQDDFWERLDDIDGPGGSLAVLAQAIDDAEAGLQNQIDTLDDIVGDPVTGLAKAHADIATLDSTKASLASVTALTGRTVVVEGQAVPPLLLTGASGDLVLTPNKTLAGADDPGEIRVVGTFINHPTLGRQAISNGTLNTSFEGTNPVPPGQRFYVVWSGQALADRFDPPLTGTLGRLFTATYDWESGVWTAYGNTGDGQTFALVENDLLVAVCGRTSSAGGSGIDWLRPAFSQLSTLDARTATLESVVTTPTTGLADRLSLVEVDLNTPTTGLKAVVAGHASVLADLDENYASATDFDLVEAEVQTARDGFASLNARFVNVINTAASDTNAVATSLSLLQARTLSPNPNLLPNPSAQNGLAGWTEVGAGGWSALPDGGFRVAPGSGGSQLRGSFFNVTAGQKVSVQAEMRVTGLTAGSYRVHLEFWDESALIGSAVAALVQDADTDWVRKVADAADNAALTAPAGTTRARLVLLRHSATNAEAAGEWRRLKAEIGERATVYSEEGLTLALNALVGGHSTAITNLETGKASATDFNIVKSEVENARDGEASLGARILRDAATAADATEAVADRVEAVEVDLNTPTTGIKAVVGGHSTAIGNLETGKASATDFDIVRSEVENARNGKTSLSAELSSMRQATADEATARATAISNVTARVDTNPNILKNSTAADGTSGWPLGGGWARFDDGEGTGFQIAGDTTNRLGYSDFYDLAALGLSAGQSLTLSCDRKLTGRTSGALQVRIDFWDASSQISTNNLVVIAADQAFGRGRGTITIPAGATRFRVRLQSNTLNVGATGRVRRIKVEPGTVDTAWTDDGLDRDLASAVTDATEALVDLENDYALARWVKKAEASGGRPALLGLVSASEGPSGVILAADEIWLGDNTYFDDASNTFITDDAGTRTIQMGPFGASGNLIFWQGPDSVAPGGATTANGTRAITRDGRNYVYGNEQQSTYREPTASNVPGTTISTSWIDVLTHTINAGPTSTDTFHVQVGLGIQVSPSRTRGSSTSQAPAGDWEVVEQDASGTTGTERKIASGKWSTSIFGSGGNPEYVSEILLGSPTSSEMAAWSDISREWPFKFGGGGRLVVRMRAEAGANLITPVVSLRNFVTRFT